MKIVHGMMVLALLVSMFAVSNPVATVTVLVVWAMLSYRHYERKNFAK